MMMMLIIVIIIIPLSVCQVVHRQTPQYTLHIANYSYLCQLITNPTLGVSAATNMQLKNCFVLMIFIDEYYNVKILHAT